jgi:organic hydroperoxide reductase OsmC/OhrA
MEEFNMAVQSKTFKYRTQVNWDIARIGTLSCNGKPDIKVATPPEFKGHAGIWSPEDLFVAALSSCFMTTFLGTAEWKGLEFLSFECDVEGTLARPDKEFLFTHATLRPRVVLPSDGDEDLARWCLEFAEKDCLIAHTISTKISLEPEIILEAPEMMQL